MRSVVSWCLLLAIAGSQCLCAETPSWNKLRYVGGTIETKVDPYDWNTTLTVNSDALLFAFGRRQTFRIPSTQVTALSYGQEAHRRVGEMITLGVLVTPLALFGVLHKSKDHFIGIQYKTSDGKAAAILLEAHKDNYKAILQALKNATGKPVENAP